MPPPPTLTYASPDAEAPPRIASPLTEHVPPRRPAPRGPDPPDVALRFSDHEREDLPTVHLAPGEVTLVEGRAGVEAMRQRLILDLAARGRSVMQVVGGNRLDSTGLARRAQAQGLDPRYVLEASVVARAFTAYQLSVLVEERLPAYLADEAAVAVAIVSDPLALYTDQDVRRQEGRQLAEQALASIQRTAAEHERPLLVVQPPRPDRRPAPGRREPASADPDRTAALLELVRSHADHHVRVHGASSGHPPDGASARVIEIPEQGERYRLAQPRSGQTRLDRFTGGEVLADG